MKKNDVKVGGVYTAKVSDKIVEVRIDGVKGTGWSATNMATGKTIYIKSAQRLRGVAKRAAATPAAPEVQKAQKATTSPTAATGAKPEAEATTKAKPAKAATPAKQGDAKAKKPKRPSCLDAAAKVLEEAGQPMTAKEMVEAAAEKGYWKSPGGKTPHATLYSAILREITTKGQDARFRKAERGKFVHA